MMPLSLIKSSWERSANESSLLEPLLEHTTLIDIRWLVRFAKGEIMAEREGVIPPWQQLPAMAEVTLEQLQAYTGVGLPVIVLSYPWHSPEHPDPRGTQLRLLLPVLSAIVAYCDTDFGGGPSSSCGVLWDFASLPQRGYTRGYDPERDDRTKQQLQRFHQSLACMHLWYSAPMTFTIVLDTPLPAQAVTTAPYLSRGWCLFEHELASIAKHPDCLLELQRLKPLAEVAARWARSNKGALPFELIQLDLDWQDVISACATERAAMTPEQFEAILLEGTAIEASQPGEGLRMADTADAANVLVPQYRASYQRLAAHVGAVQALPPGTGTSKPAAKTGSKTSSTKSTSKQTKPKSKKGKSKK